MKYIDITRLKIGDKVIISEFGGLEGYYKQRLLSFGLIPGVELFINRIAPFGDPVELILFNGVSLILRKSEAKVIKFIKLN